MKTKIRSQWALSRRSTLTLVASFAVIAGALLLFARAATTSAILEAETAALTGNVASIDDTNASGQKALRFGQAESTNPTPNPGTAATIIAVSDMQYGPSGTDRSGTAARTVAMAANAQYVIMAGDIAYDGTAGQYSEFDAEYGSILSKIRPSPGNHDNYTGDQASGYDTYFDAVPHGTSPNYWYSFDAGAWHIVSLNAGVDTSTASYSEGSAQLQWLESDLAANATKPMLLFFHAPRYTGANYSDQTDLQDSVKPIWKIALAHKVDIIVNGHDHSYQRFALMDEQGNKTANGIREFIAATGCYSQRDVNSSSVPNLEFWSKSTNTDWCGALQLKLYADHYEWEFHNNADQILDSGTEPVHAR